jgi:hypothetical protein
MMLDWEAALTDQVAGHHIFNNDDNVRGSEVRHKRKVGSRSRK